MSVRNRLGAAGVSLATLVGSTLCGGWAYSCGEALVDLYSRTPDSYLGEPTFGELVGGTLILGGWGLVCAGTALTLGYAAVKCFYKAVGPEYNLYDW